MSGLAVTALGPACRSALRVAVHDDLEHTEFGIALLAVWLAAKAPPPLAASALVALALMGGEDVEALPCVILATNMHELLPTLAKAVR